MAAVPAESAPRRNHPVGRDIRPASLAHDVADRSRCPGTPGHFGDVAVGGDTPGRDASDNRQDPRLECIGRGLRPARGSPRQRSASFSGRPSAFGSGMPTSVASVGATSAGDAMPS